MQTTFSSLSQGITLHTQNPPCFTCFILWLPREKRKEKKKKSNKLGLWNELFYSVCFIVLFYPKVSLKMSNKMFVMILWYNAWSCVWHINGLLENLPDCKVEEYRIDLCNCVCGLYLPMIYVYYLLIIQCTLPNKVKFFP